MNERIKQLLLESGFKIFGDKIVAGDFGSSGNATLCSQKFAELIVKEMVDECAKVCVQHTGWTPDMIAKQVKQHFGVE